MAIKNIHTARAKARLLIVASLVLTIIGILFVYSASAAYAQQRFGDGAYYLKRHILGVALGLIGAVFLACIPLRVLKRLTPTLFIVALLLTAATLIPGLGVKVHGSRRWLRMPGAPVQPSEALKYAAILMLAGICARYEYVERRFLRRYGSLALILGAVAGVLLLQPDFGMTVTIVATGLLLLFASYTDWQYVLFCGAGLLPLAALLVALEPYRLKRLLVFLDPWADPQGAGFQVIQSLIAVGSGGFWGAGFGNSRQKLFYLPMQHTDFIFAVIAEEIGFVGCAFLIIVFMLFAYAGISLALRLRDSYARYAVLGYTFVVSLQTITNMAVAIGLFPTKGIGLPFISGGNSSLIGVLAFLGVAWRAAVEEDRGL